MQKVAKTDVAAAIVELVYFYTDYTQIKSLLIC